MNVLRLAIGAGLAVLAASPAQERTKPPTELPAAAVTKLGRSLSEAKPHRTHIWRDTAPTNLDGTVNAYVEIAQGDRRKWEFDMAKAARAIDRMIPEDVGGYPVNYGFVPQTISYDGDPFDALVLGPAIPGGQVVPGVVVGLMLMEDEKGWDAKVVLSRRADDGRPREQLSTADQHRIADYFRRYKANQPGLFANVPGWGSREDGLAYVKVTHAFFRECRSAAAACRIER